MEKKMERMEIKMDLILDMLREVAQPKYYYASDKAQPLNEQPEEKYLFIPNPKYGHHHFEKELLEKVLEDTPEEWEEEIDYTLDCIIRGETEGGRSEIQKMAKANKEDIKDIIKQLLEEREREAREEGWRNGERYHFLLERQEEVSLNEEEVEELNLLSRELSKLKDK